MKKTLTAAAVCAVVSPIGSLALVSGASAQDTNVSLGGYVRGGYYYLDDDDGPSTGRFEYRGRLQLDARSDNGLRGTLRLQGTDGGGQTGGTGQANVIIDRALLQFAGGRLGFSDTFETTFHGYGNFIERRDGDYGFDQGFFVDYTGSFAGFSYGIGVQDTDFEGGVTNSDVDPYFGVGYDIAGVGVRASYTQSTDDGEGQFKFSGTYGIAGINLKAWFRGQTGENRYSAAGDVARGDADDDENGDGIDADNSSFGGSASYSINSAVSVAIGLSSNDLDDSTEIIIGATYNIVPGLSFRPEIAFLESDNDTDDVDIGFRLYRTF